MDGDGPDQRDGQCGWQFGLRRDDGGGSSGGVELEGVDGGGIDCDEYRSVGSGGFVFAGWSGERGGAAGSEHSSGSLGGAGGSVEADDARERNGAGKLGREPQRALDEWGDRKSVG